jgi:protein-disulfide isomerase
MDKSKRQARLERKRSEQRRNQTRVLIFIVIAAVAITALFVYGGQTRTGRVHDYTQKNGDQLGSPDAPVLIQEYADFQCIHCYNFYNETELALIDEYVDEGVVLYELNLVDFIGQESAKSAEAAYCAADQDLFWEYHDVVFANYSQGNTGGYSEDRLIAFAETVNMDMAAFTQCLQSGEKAEIIAQNKQDAADQGITGTPSFVVNGTVLNGNVPFNQMIEAIENALAASGS